MVHNTDDAYNTKPKKFQNAGCNFTFYTGIVFILLGIAELAFGCTDAQKWDMFLFMAAVSWILASLFFVFWYSYNLVLIDNAEDMKEDYSEFRSGERSYQPSRAPDEVETIGSRRRKKVRGEGSSPVSHNKVVPMVENPGFVEDDFDLKDNHENHRNPSYTSNVEYIQTRSEPKSKPKSGRYSDHKSEPSKLKPIQTTDNTTSNLKLVSRSRSNSNISNVSNLKLVNDGKPYASLEVFKINM